MTDPVCVISGVGPGTGSALARRFATGGHRVAMLARNPQRLVELETRVVGDAGKTDERVMARSGRGEMRGIANVTLDHAKIGMALRQKRVAEEHRIVDGDLVALIKQLGHQQTSTITRAAGDQNAIEEFIPGNAHDSGRGLCKIDGEG